MLRKFLLVFSLLVFISFFIVEKTNAATTLQKIPINNLGLVGYWSFNGADVSGTTAYDRSGQGNDGTITGAVTTTIGKLAQALNFPGTTADHVEVANESNFDFERTDKLSISTWIKYTGTAIPLIAKSQNSGNFPGFGLSIDSSNDDLHFGLIGSGGDSLSVHTAFVTLLPSIWYHVVMTYDGSSTAAGTHLYINGTDMALVVDSDNLSTSILNNTQLRIGGSPASGSPYTGIIDDVRIYNRALSATEVRNLYQSGKVTIRSTGRIFLVSPTGSLQTWTVPSDWNSNNNTIEVIGGGGGGATSVTGGGGGAYAKKRNVVLTRGATVGFVVGTGGASDTNGTDTYFCNSTSNCASISGTAVKVGAKAGLTNGTAGAASGSVGDVKYDGGSGAGAPQFCGTSYDSGGGGAAGPHGPGASGAGASGCDGDSAGGGGGGADGGTVGGFPPDSSTGLGGNGGNNYLGTGGGTAIINGAGGAGLNGGGGSGARAGSGGAGGNGTEWDATHGSGGGGGATSPFPDGYTGGNGGQYGGGGGGGSTGNTGGTGGQGLIVITYYPTNVNTSQNNKLTNGLVGLWSFDGADVTDAVYDRSGQGNNGGFFGGATSTAKTIGKIGQALSFDGVNDYVTSGSSLSIGTVDTFSLWFKPAYTVDSTTGGGSLVQLRYGDGNSWYVSLGSSTVLCTDEYITISDTALGTRTCVTDGGSISPAWHHMILRWNGSAYDIYIDGIKKTTVNAGGSDAGRLTSANAVYFGTIDGDGGGLRLFYTGLLDDARIYNRALSVAEVKQLYLIGK